MPVSTGALPSMLKHALFRNSSTPKPSNLQTHLLSGMACHLPQMGGWHHHPSSAALHASLFLAATTDFNL